METNDFIIQHRYAIFNESKTIVASSNDLIWLDDYLLKLAMEYNEYIFIYDYDKNAIIKEYDPSTDIS